MKSLENLKLLSVVIFAALTLCGCGVAQHTYIESLPENNRSAFLSDKTDQELCHAFTSSVIKEKTNDSVIQELQKKKIGLCITNLGVKVVPGGGERVVRNTELPELSAEFLEGKSNLTCTNFSCGYKWGSLRGRLKELYRLGQWKELAKEVLHANNSIDLALYYLGRASEELGSANAAREYYAKALLSDLNCAGVLNTCDGFDIPKVARDRIAMIEDSINGSSAWVSLQNSEDEKDISKFISDFPKSTHRNTAEIHLRWLRLRESQSIGDFLSFLGDFPKSERSGQVANLALALAQKINNLDDYLGLAKNNSAVRTPSLNQAKAILDPQIKSLQAAGDCDEAEKLAKKLNDIQNGFYPFSARTCKKELFLSQATKSKDPKAIYFNAIKLEDAEDFESAREVYRAIIEKFPSDTFALRAADRLLAVNEKIDLIKKEGLARERELSAAEDRRSREALERWRQTAERERNDREAQQRADEATRLQRSTCQAARQTCINSCSRIQDRRQKFTCESKCGYCN